MGQKTGAHVRDAKVVRPVETRGLDINVRRNAGVAVAEQIRTQIELAILSGHLPSGSRLPPVRSLALKLRTHPNTISGAYRKLEQSGHVVLRSGAGVFVRARADAKNHPSAGTRLREAIRDAVGAGLSPEAIAGIVDETLYPDRPTGIIVADPSDEMAAIYAHEIEAALGIPVSTTSVSNLEATGSAPARTVVAVLPYHVARLEAFVPRDLLVVFTLTVPSVSNLGSEHEGAGLVTVISASPMLLSFARVYLGGALGSDFEIEACLLKETQRWQRLLAGSDAVFVDAVSAPSVPLQSRKVHALKLVSADSLRRLREALGLNPRP